MRRAFLIALVLCPGHFALGQFIYTNQTRQASVIATVNSVDLMDSAMTQGLLPFSPKLFKETLDPSFGASLATASQDSVLTDTMISVRNNVGGGASTSQYASFQSASLFNVEFSVAKSGPYSLVTHLMAQFGGYDMGKNSAPAGWFSLGGNGVSINESVVSGILSPPLTKDDSLIVNLTAGLQYTLTANATAYESWSGLNSIDATLPQGNVGSLSYVTLTPLPEPDALMLIATAAIVLSVLVARGNITVVAHRRP
jgi:hypothetical protein